MLALAEGVSKAGYCTETVCSDVKDYSRKYSTCRAIYGSSEAFKSNDESCAGIEVGNVLFCYALITR